MVELTTPGSAVRHASVARHITDCATWSGKRFDWDPDHLSNEPPLEGPPIPITIDMVKKAISKMKSGKAAGPSGIVVEMIKAAGDTGATMIRNLATALICDGKVPTDWEQSFIVCLYKGKGDALDTGNYPGLKLTEQAMKILEVRRDKLEVVASFFCCCVCV